MNSDPATAHNDPVGVRIDRILVPCALERLIQVGNPKSGAQRLVRNARNHGIDLGLVWGVLGNTDRDEPAVRQVCMIVPGAGGTGMCFISNPKNETKQAGLGSREVQIQEIGASLTAALQDLPTVARDRIKVAQMLFEPDQDWAHEIARNAGMISVGTLDYMRLGFDQVSTWSNEAPNWPSGIRVRPIKTMEADHDLLSEALERSYEDTLDCPELCGMRTMDDVIESHKSTGEFDPSRWWLLLDGDRPAGCCLLAHCPANESVELVYIGLSKRVQGHGFGERLLRHALGHLRIKDRVLDVTCAVDRRNIPASKVYSRLGFQVFDARCAYVRSI